MFVKSILFYILGICIHLFLIDNPYIVINFIVFVLVCSVIYFLSNRFYNSYYFSYLRIAFLYLSFFIFGLLVVDFHIFTNKTVLLDKPLEFAYFYGEVDKVEKSSYDNKSRIYLKNLIISNEENPPSSARLTYNYPNSLEKGDIVSALASFFPPSKPLLPYSFNFRKNSFYNKIGANGYIIGKVSLIDNFSNPSLEKLSIIKESFLNNVIHSMKKDSSNSRVFTFLVAVSLGQYTFLPEAEMVNLRTTSLSHYISISGFHITLITAFIFFSLRRILALVPRISLMYNTKKIASVLTILILLFYLVILGENIPAIRAIIMSIGFLLAILFNFRAISFNSLFLAGFIVLFFIPQAIFSAGFLLSFFATLAIVIFWNFKYTQFLYYKTKKSFFLRTIFNIFLLMALTLFIEVTILPIVIYFFGNISFLGILANLFVSPLFSFLILPFMLLYFISPHFIAIYFFKIAELSMNLVLDIAKFIHNLPFSTYYASFFPSYFLIGFLFFYILFAVTKHYSRYLFLIPSLFIMLYFFFFTKYPDILINSDLSLVAFKESSSPLLYIFSDPKKEKFTKNFWLKDPSSNIGLTFKDSKNFICEDFHCVGKIQNSLISYSTSLKYLTEDCSEIDIIIVANTSNVVCKNALIIDKSYLEKSGSLALYLK